jgi:hypothetical protein
MSVNAVTNAGFPTYLPGTTWPATTLFDVPAPQRWCIAVRQCESDNEQKIKENLDTRGLGLSHAQCNVGASSAGDQAYR